MSSRSVFASILLFGLFLAANLSWYGVGLAAADAHNKASSNQPLVIYSSRKSQLLEPVLDAYEKATGQATELVTGEAGVLMERLAGEGDRTQADLFVTVDAGNLWQAAQRGLLLPLESKSLSENVPAALRDPQGRWFGLSKRARTVVYSTERVDPKQITTYAGLADDIWRDRLCLRTSQKVYNQSLTAMLMQRHGAEKTEDIVRGWVGNLAAPVFPNDTKLIEAIAQGVCDAGLINTYYFGRLQDEQPDLAVAIAWPEDVHVNVSGGGVVRHSDQSEQATALLEWLASSQAQNLFADANKEYPVNPTVEPVAQVAAWGSFSADPNNIAQAGARQREAIMLMDRAGWE